MTRKADKPTKIQSTVYKNIRWDFTEVTDELERLRLEHTPEMANEEPNKGRNKTYPLAWILRVPTFTRGLEKMDVQGADRLDERACNQIIMRAFKACGITTNTEISKLARYANGSPISKWDIRTMSFETIQERLFPALCDAYCIARKNQPSYLSQTFLTNDDAFINGTRVPKDRGEAERMLYHISVTRKIIEREAIWVLLSGELDSYPSIACDSYDLMRQIYRRSVALYATLMLSGDELGDLAHVAAALVAQHIAAFSDDMWGEHDHICLSSERNKLDFTADRYSSNMGNALPLHALASTEELASKGEDVTSAALRYASTQTLAYIELVAHAELERRSKIGSYYMPELYAETEPTDEDMPSA